MKAPILFDFTGKKALVVGAGPVGKRRAQKLRDYGCSVYVSSLEGEPYDKRLLVGIDVVVAATDDRNLNERILKEARQAGIVFCNSVNESKLSTFSFPGSFNKDGVIVSVFTDGASPGFTKQLTEYFRKNLDGDLLTRFKLMRALRPRAKSLGISPKDLENLSILQLEELLEK